MYTIQFLLLVTMHALEKIVQVGKIKSLNLNYGYEAYIMKPTLWSLHYEAYIMKPTLWSLHYEAYIMKPTLWSLHYEVYIMKPTLWSLHYEAYNKKNTHLHEEGKSVDSH